MAYQSLMDLMNADAMKQAQLYGMGQEAKLRNLQMSQAERGVQEQEQLRSVLPQLMQGGDPQGMLKNLMASGNPAAIEFAGKIAPVLATMQKDTKATWQDRGDVLAQLDAYGQPTGVTVPKGAAPQQPEKLPWYVQKGAKGEPIGIDPLYREFEQMKARAGAAGGGTPYFTPVQTAGGVMAFNARTGRMEPIQVGGASVVGAQADPTLQGRIAGAKQAGEAEAKRTFNMSGAADIIDQAETILKAGKATSSYLGKGIDVAAGLVGATPPGAAEADQLKVLGGYLVAKMPRMEGPQSNYDVQNYKEMAGDVGNAALPIKRRMAALNTLRGIITKYDRINSRNPQLPASSTVPTGNVVDFGSLR